MTVTVIVVLEMINIQNQHGKRVAVTRRPVDFVLELIVEMP